MEKRKCPAGVIHIYCIAPGPVISASTAVSPALMLMKGLIFNPCPSPAADFESVPSTAMPPLPFLPVIFSGLIDRITAFDSRHRFPMFIPSPLNAAINHLLIIPDTLRQDYTILLSRSTLSNHFCLWGVLEV
jgi:hypothetical protein